MSYPGRDAVYVNPVDGHHNFKEVLAKRSDLQRIDGGRMVPPAAPSGGGVGFATYYAGLVLGYCTSGPNAGLWAPYASGNSDGSQNAAGILQMDVTIDSLGNGSEIGIIKQGVLFKDLLIGLDAGAITALGGKPFVEHGVNLLTIYA